MLLKVPGSGTPFFALSTATTSQNNRIAKLGESSHYSTRCFICYIMHSKQTIGFFVLLVVNNSATSIER